MTNPNTFIKGTPNAEWKAEPRVNILDPAVQFRARFPGLDPDAMQVGPTDGHYSIMAGKIESGELGTTPTTHQHRGNLTPPAYPEV